MALLATDERAKAMLHRKDAALALQTYAHEALDQGNLPLGAALAVVSCS